MKRGKPCVSGHWKRKKLLKSLSMAFGWRATTWTISRLLMIIVLLREEGKYIRSRYIHYDGVPHYEQPRQN